MPLPNWTQMLETFAWGKYFSASLIEMQFCFNVNRHKNTFS